MTYQESITFLFNALPVWERAGAGAYKPGLERIGAFMAALGNPHRGLRTVHVAGTNGKGSVCHMLAAVLRSAGLRTGLFTSPHLVDFRERIRVDGDEIPEDAVVEFTERWRGEMVATGLTFFEMATAMGLWWCRRSGCDIAVIETGLGGRLDSTNIITPEVSVVTNIGLEHTRYLGDTIAAIAAEKAGIIKPGVPVVIGEHNPESDPVFRTAAATQGSEITFADDFNYELRITNYECDLPGDYQRKNLATVLATIDVLRGEGWSIPDDAVKRGLRNAARLTGLRGRWQVVGRAPLIILDTAHNAHGLAEVVAQIARTPRQRLYMVLGLAADKDLDAILPLLPTDAHYILTAADTPRAMPAETLAFRVNYELRITNYETAPTVAGAVRRALAMAGPRDMIFIGGSNFVVGEALAALDC